jgi:16S rRNA (uracil1498-N3)-methyltransferase
VGGPTEGPIPLATWLDAASDAVGVVAVRGGAMAVHAVGQAGARVLVGPEGGLTERELEHALARGFEAVSLGPWTLRTEVAVVAALSLLLPRSGPGHGDGHGHAARGRDAR